MMPDQVVLSVGTRKGLFLLKSDKARKAWKLEGPYLKGWQIFHAFVDTRGTPQVHAAAVSDVYATTTFQAPVGTSKFKGAKRPPLPPKLLPSHMKFIKKWNIPVAPRIWHLEPGAAGERKVLFAGTAPAGLFRSDDGGRNWEEVKSLTQHPSRPKWMPGAGGMCLHSIQIDPRNPRRILVGISAAGVFRSDDAGRSWSPHNQGLQAFGGKTLKKETVGTCVHKVLAHPRMAGRVYQQNHVGTYVSNDYGAVWQPIHKGLPTDFGFGLALDSNDPDRCFVLPLIADDYSLRTTPGKVRVYRYEGRPGHWTPQGRGLPASGAYQGVLREGMSSDTLKPCGVYFGTSTGALFGSADEGRTWSALAQYLPPILSVSAAVV